MSPKRPTVRQMTSKTVTIYNSAGKRDRKMGAANTFEQSRNSLENWEFHFKAEDIETVKGIIKIKDINGVPLVIGAAVLDEKEVLMTLIKHGYNINESDKNNVTPVAWAVKQKHIDMIQLLLENNADLSIRPHNGDDVACIALGSAQWDEETFLLLFNWLKKAGAVDVNAFNKHGLSILHLAVRREWNALIDTLLQNEVNVNVTTVNGVTPLMLASYRNDYNIVARLLNRGATVKRKNSDGFTALCYAFSSAITKELEPPFLVVDKLQIELAKLRIDLPTYLKDRIKLILNPSKQQYTDQPSPEQMLSHIVIFILKNVENGFELLVEVMMASVIKEALDKFIDDKLNLKLPLAVLNAVFKHTAFTVKQHSLVLTEFIEGGCFDLCLKVMRMYEDENFLIQLAITPIILFGTGYSVAQRWFEVIKKEVATYLPKYEESMDLIDATPEQMDYIRERLDDFKYNICNLKHPLQSEFPAEKDKQLNNKKGKRRTKQLKSKISKIKSNELTERYSNTMMKANDFSRYLCEQTGDFADVTSDEEQLCTNAINMVMSLLEDDNVPEPPPHPIKTTHNSRRNSKDHSRTINTHTNLSSANTLNFGVYARKMPETGDSRIKDLDSTKWQDIIKNLPFQCPKPYKHPGDFDNMKPTLQSLDVDSIIKYLEQLLGIIVGRYKAAWINDKSVAMAGNEIDCIVASMENDLDSVQCLEKEQLRFVYREFYNLTRNVKDVYDSNPDACIKIFKVLEKILLNHNIRGTTILESVADLEIIKVKVTMPSNFTQSLPSYMESVMAGDTDEDPNIKIEFKEHMSPKNMDANSMGDYVYVNEVPMSHPSGKQAPISQSQPHSHSHHNLSTHVQRDLEQSLNTNLQSTSHSSYTNLQQKVMQVPLLPSSSVPGPQMLHIPPISSKSPPAAIPVSSLLNLWDDDEDSDENHTLCCYKGYHGEEIPDKEKCSKWYGMVRSLETMDDGQSFLNGTIRLSNIEKRKSHLLSLNGHYSMLEVGLTNDNKPIAVKILSKSDPYAILLKNQVEPLLKLKHKYILPYHTCKYESNLLIIATPLCEYNLGQYVQKMRQPPSQICKVNVIRQMLCGLMYLHNNDEPIVHGNLKPSNVLVDIHGTVKIAEFGIYKAKLKIKHLPESTIIWFATELYKMYKMGVPLSCTCASDIQVAGMLVHFTTFCGTHPFGTSVPDILRHLVDGTVELMVSDNELHDLLSWMLMGDPSERPSIHQVLSHIFFWSKQKKWTYILLCAGFGLLSTIPMDVEKLHSSLDSIAEKEKIKGNGWVMTARKQYPELSLTDASDTPSGLLKFIKDVVDNTITLAPGPDKEKSFSAFILGAFPHFVLALYRMIENSEWSDHRVFMRFHNVIDY